MKRDKDFLRQILLDMQESKSGFILHELVLNPSEEDVRLDHHLDLLVDEGLVSRKGQRAFRLTPLGHDAVEAIAEPKMWLKLKESTPKEAYEIAKNVGTSLGTTALSKLMGWS